MRHGLGIIAELNELPFTSSEPQAAGMEMADGAPEGPDGQYHTCHMQDRVWTPLASEAAVAKNDLECDGSHNFKFAPVSATGDFIKTPHHGDSVIFKGVFLEDEPLNQQGMTVQLARGAKQLHVLELPANLASMHHDIAGTIIAAEGG